MPFPYTFPIELTEQDYPAQQPNLPSHHHRIHVERKYGEVLEWWWLDREERVIPARLRNL